MAEESGRRRSMKRTGAAAALFLGLAAGGYGIASAAGGSGATTTAPQGYGYGPGPGHDRGGHGPRGDHTALTGDTLAKATAAATAKLPGATVDAAFEDDHGDASYVVLVTKADGTHAAVLLDDAFAVVEVRTDPGRGRGPHGPGGRGRETALTGTTLAKVTAAAKAKVPGGTVEHAETDADGNAKYEVHMTTAAGKRVTVYVNADFAAIKVEDAPAGRPGRHP